ncbi:putative bromodomain protein [Trichinella spiralis]|uniref:putative bromodomain protein n=1 Tax=Trichinella spiralis TaxID=6334 RepID=UPI0001EFC881|nr:putative bromodomain protein [Trichinella spiralis]
MVELARKCTSNLSDYRTRTELITLFLQTTKRKKGEATVCRLGLEDQRWSMVVPRYVCIVVVVWLKKLAVTHRRRQSPIKTILTDRCLIVIIPSGKRESERNDETRHSVRLLWRKNQWDLPDNFAVAKWRLETLKRRIA